MFPIGLAFTGGEFRRALAAWEHELRPGIAGHPKAVFVLALAVDFLFIPVYTALLAGGYLKLRGGAARTRLDSFVLIACAGAAGFDVLENVLFLALRFRTWDALVPLASTASALKWAAIAFILSVLLQVLVSGTVARVLSLCRYALLSIALGTLPLVALGQGRDLIVALADDDAPAEYRVFFYLTLAVWGLSVWYWSRVVLDAEFWSADGPYTGLPRHLPRVLGAATLLLPAVPIALATNAKWARAAMILGCVALAALLLVFVRRRHRRSGGPRPEREAFSLGAAGRIVAVSLAVSLALFALFVFAPLPAGRHLGPVAILFIAAANTVFFGSLAVFATRASRVRIEIIALTCAAAFSFWNDNHDVPVERLEDSLPSIEQRFAEWHGRMPAGDRSVVFLAAADGGGIRAAYWTATVLGALDEGETRAFRNRLFAVSGISGGTLGAAVYAGLRHDYPQGGIDMRRTGQAILAEDLLSPTLAKLVTGD